MSVCTHVLILLVLQIGLVKCLSWDIIVVGGDKQLQFYNNGTLKFTEDIPLHNTIYSITYDPVHYRILIADIKIFNVNQISSFDLVTRNMHPLLTRISNYYLSIAYDPVKQLLFWRQGTDSIYSYSLNPASTKNAADGDLIVTTNHFCADIAVDIYGGYIYWITDHEIERARFDGSKREVLLDNNVYFRYSLAIDQQTQKMYWTETIHGNDNHVSIESTNFNGKNRRTLYTIKNETEAGSLTVSNDFIYWHGFDQKAIWQLPKNHSQKLKAKLICNTNRYNWYFQVIAENYAIKYQIKENQNCESLKSLILNEWDPECIVLCIHGTKVSGESRCKCTQGYTGERCDVNICQNYCLEGNCSVSAEGQPKCSCTDGYSGERCEVNTCHKHCLNNGVCSLNEEDEPACECTADYEGERCDVATTHSGVYGDNTMQQTLRDLRNEVKQVQVIKEDLQRILHSEVKQIIKEELQCILQFYWDKNDENETKIQKCQKSMKNLEKQSIGLDNLDEIRSNTLTSNTFSETN